MSLGENKRNRTGKAAKNYRCSAEVSDLGSPEGPHMQWRYLSLVVFTCVAIYSNTLFMSFVWDDVPQIRENVQIRSLQNIPSMFSSDVWKGVEGDHRASYYRPLFTLSLALDYAVWDGRPPGYHLTNMALHTLSAVLIYLIALKMLKNAPSALFAALFFSAHPAHAEAVAWVSGRSEPLSALFLLISFYAYQSYREKNKVFSIGISLAAFFLSLLSKEMAITYPLLLLIYELCLGEKAFIKRLQWPVVFCLTTIPYFLLRYLFLHKNVFSNGVPLLWRLYTVPGLIVNYLKIMVLPVDLKVYYDLAVRNSFTEPGVIIPGMIVLGIFSLIYILRRLSILTFGLLWFFIALIPVLGILVPIQPALMAERYLYLPSIGFSFAAGQIYLLVLHGETLKRSQTPAKKTFASQAGFSRKMEITAYGLIMVLSLLNFQRNFAWKDHATFVHNRIADAPNDPAAHSDLGLIYLEQRRLAEAEKEFVRALELNPGLASVYNNLGSIHMEQGHIEEAEKEFNSAIKTKPLYAEAHYNLGLIHGEKKDYDSAEAELKKALELKGANPADIHFNLGIIYMKKGATEKANSEFEDAVRLNLTNKHYRVTLQKARELRDRKSK